MLYPARKSAISLENEMGIAAVVPANQSIKPDTHPAELWESGNSVFFIAHILDTDASQRVTGVEAPETLISVVTYGENGKPFLENGEEKSEVIA